AVRGYRGPPAPCDGRAALLRALAAGAELRRSAWPAVRGARVRHVRAGLRPAQRRDVAGLPRAGRSGVGPGAGAGRRERREPRGGDARPRLPFPRRPPPDPRRRRISARALGKHLPDDRRLAGAVARAPAELRSSPRRNGRRPARRLRRRLTVDVSTRPAPGRSWARRRRPWYGACRAADARRNGARDASPGGGPT